MENKIELHAGSAEPGSGNPFEIFVGVRPAFSSARAAHDWLRDLRDDEECGEPIEPPSASPDSPLPAHRSR